MFGKFPSFSPLLALIILALLLTETRASDLNRVPIEYAKAPADNVVTRLQGRLAEGEAKLNFDDDRGYLKSILKELNVPESSQMLVFSKTSLQRPPDLYDKQTCRWPKR